MSKYFKELSTRALKRRYLRRLRYVWKLQRMNVSGELILHDGRYVSVDTMLSQYKGEVHGIQKELVHRGWWIAP